MLLLMLLLDVYLTIQKQSDQVYLPLRIKLDCFVRTCGIEPHRGKFLSACHYFSGLPFLYQMRNIYGRKQSYHLHVHRGMQDATSGIFKPYLFATFSGLTNSLFALHPHRIVHFLTLGLLQHAVLVNVGGLEPPLTEPKSVVLPLHHTSFIGLSR